jgi:glycosyltransferase involved in cell wall biosynthesis
MGALPQYEWNSVKLSKPIVVWLGRQHQLSGYGFAARQHVAALRSIGADVVAIDSASGSLVGSVPEGLVKVTQSRDRTTIKAVDPDRPIVTVVHDRPDFFTKVTASGRARLIGYSYWETSSLPPNWAGWQTSMDAVWTSSQFNADIFEEAGVPPWMIEIVGHPIDPLLLEVRDTIPSSARRWKESTVFLSVISSTVGRRDMNLLFEAFSAAFDAGDDVALVLKVPEDGGAGLGETFERAFRETSSMRASRLPPSIYVIADQLTREQIVRLHASVDAYISCERGNGWDLPAMDSLVLGVPIVNVGFGASTAFCSSGDTYTVEVSDRMVACDDTMFGAHFLYSGQFWPYVDPQRMAEQIRSVFDDKDEAARWGASASLRLRQKYSAEKVANEVLELVGGLTDVDVRSNAPASVTLHRADNAWNGGPTKILEQTGINGLQRFMNRLQRSMNQHQFKSPLDPGRALVLAKEIAKLSLKAAKKVSASGPKGAVSAVISPPDLNGGSQGSVARGVSQSPKRAFKKWDDTRSMAKTIEDYHDCVRGATTRFNLQETEIRRRTAWSKLGYPTSPSEDRERLDRLRNCHEGERVFILGNGPSLVKCDLNKLGSEFTFGVNKIHLLFDQIDWRPNFYTLLDWKMGASVAQDLAVDDETIRFFPERFRGMLPTTSQTYWYTTRPMGIHIDDQFEPNAVRGIPSKGTVLVTAIQQAFFLGFRDIYLIGVDAAYQIPESVIQSGPDYFGTGTKLHLESTADDDANHFAANYFGTGDRWHDPNVAEMRRMFLRMRKGVERHGGRLVNATVGGELDELPRVNFGDLF